MPHAEKTGSKEHNSSGIIVEHRSHSHKVDGERHRTTALPTIQSHRNLPAISPAYPLPNLHPPTPILPRYEPHRTIEYRLKLLLADRPHHYTRQAKRWCITTLLRSSHPTTSHMTGNQRQEVHTETGTETAAERAGNPPPPLPLPLIPAPAPSRMKHLKSVDCPGYGICASPNPTRFLI